MADQTNDGRGATIVPADQRGMRLLYMAIFGIIGYAIYWLVVFLAVVQFGLGLINGRVHANLRDFCTRLNAYFGSVLGFLSYASDRVPFPFSPLEAAAGGPAKAASAASEARPKRKRAPVRRKKPAAKAKPESSAAPTRPAAGPGDGPAGGGGPAGPGAQGGGGSGADQPDDPGGTSGGDSDGGPERF